jgi:hypothetical protein
MVELWAELAWCSVASSVCLVRECASMWNACDIYFLMASDQLVPKKLLGAFVC